MSAKTDKLRNEHRKNDEKIAQLQARNQVIDETVQRLENEEIVAEVRGYGFSPEELSLLLKDLRERGPAVVLEGTHEQN